MVQFHHKILGHAGEVRVYDSIRTRFYHPKLKAVVENICKNCKTCHKYKQHGLGQGQLSARQVTAAPWEEVHVDLIGPWNVEVNGITMEFHALTCIDPVTNITELIRINRKTSQHTAMKFKNCWLS